MIELMRHQNKFGKLLISRATSKVISIMSFTSMSVINKNLFGETRNSEKNEIETSRIEKYD